jgi:hypothetical protein
MNTQNLKRRQFLGSMAAVPAAPLLLEAAAAAVAAPQEAAGAETDTGQTVRLAEYAAGMRYEDIPAEVRQRIKDCIADTVGVILFGAEFPWSRMIVAQAERMGGRDGKSTIFGRSSKVCAPAAALAHGAMAHAFE